MNQIRLVSFAAALAFAAIPGFAQQEAASRSTPANAAPTSTDCGKAPMKRHNHAAERGLGINDDSKAKGAPCGHDGAVSAAGAEAKKKQGHNHAQFHKNQP